MLDPPRYNPKKGEWILSRDGYHITLSIPEAHDVAWAILNRIEGVKDGVCAAKALMEEADRMVDAGEDSGHLRCAATEVTLRWRLRRMIKRYIDTFVRRRPRTVYFCDEMVNWPDKMDMLREKADQEGEKR